MIKRERQAQLAELHTLRGLAAGETDPLTVLLTEGAALQAEARLRLTELAEARRAELVRAAAPASPAAPVAPAARAARADAG